MSRYTVHQNKHYRATIKLGMFQSIAGNEAVADKFREAGFVEVKVTGSGRTRTATGLWPHKDATAEIPNEVTEIIAT